MKNNQQKTNWVIDVILFTGFLLAFFLDITGLFLHQWLGVFLGILALVHLVVHWQWFSTVTDRFLTKTSNRSRLYYLIDFAILGGFALIGLTGLIISSWLNLSLTNYQMWRDLHVDISIVTLLIVVLKIGFHWKWIVNTARTSVFAFPAPVAPTRQPVLAQVTVSPTPDRARARQLNRRDFIRLMGIVGAASLLAMTNALNADNLTAAGQASQTELTEEEQIKLLVQQILDERAAQEAAQQTQTAQLSEANPTATPDAAPTVQPQAQSIQQNTQTNSCVIRCNRGCSAPGRCRRFTDSNGDNRCDLSECV
jgi:hypothetical protein